MATAAASSNDSWSHPPDRRENTRVPLTVAVVKTAGAELCLCQSVDISSTGMSMRRAKGKPLSSDTPVSLEFSLPGTSEVLRVKAQVVREKPQGRYCASAVVFEPLPRKLSWRLRRFVARQRAA